MKIKPMFILIFLSLLISCSQVEPLTFQMSSEQEENDMVLRDVLIIQHAILKNHKDKYGGYNIINNKEILIMHTGLNIIDIYKYKNLVKSRKVNFKRVRFSLQELKSIKKIVREKLVHMTDNGIKIGGIKVDMLSNRVLIELLGEVETEKKKILAYFPSKYHKYFRFVYWSPNILNFN